MEFIDSHAHINAEQFTNNWLEIVRNSADANVSIIINNAADLASSEWGIEQANKSSHVFSTVGIHPEFLLETSQPITESDYNNLRRLISLSEYVVAIGEIGLDYTLNNHKATAIKQQELLRNQIEIALEYNLPITLHVRDLPGKTQCFTDLMGILQEFTTSPSGTSSNCLSGVFHCWTGTTDQIQQALEIGFYVSFSGILTYRSAGHIIDAAKLAPLDKILIETDSPYLTPEPARTTIRPTVNQPQYVIMTAEKLANIRGVSLQTIAEATTRNTRRLFKLY